MWQLLWQVDVGRSVIAHVPTSILVMTSPCLLPPAQFMRLGERSRSRAYTCHGRGESGHRGRAGHVRHRRPCVSAMHCLCLGGRCCRLVAPALAFPFIPAVASSVFVCRTAPTKSRLVRTRWRVWARGAFRCPAWGVLTINAAEVPWCGRRRILRVQEVLSSRLTKASV